MLFHGSVVPPISSAGTELAFQPELNVTDSTTVTTIRMKATAVSYCYVLLLLLFAPPSASCFWSPHQSWSNQCFSLSGVPLRCPSRSSFGPPSASLSLHLSMYSL